MLVLGHQKLQLYLLKKAACYIVLCLGPRDKTQSQICPVVCSLFLLQSNQDCNTTKKEIQDDNSKSYLSADRVRPVLSVFAAVEAELPGWRAFSSSHRERWSDSSSPGYLMARLNTAQGLGMEAPERQVHSTFNHPSKAIRRDISKGDEVCCLQLTSAGGFQPFAARSTGLASQATTVRP
jgi:hypothetical protein